MKISIAPWTENDIPDMAEIEKSCMKAPWTEKMLKEEYQNPFFKCYTAKKEDVIAGYINYHIIADEYHIANIAVKENCRRQGIASFLLGELIQTAQKNNIKGITLEVGETNTAAAELYKKHGFNCEGVRKKYYGNENALIMWKYL